MPFVGSIIPARVATPESTKPKRRREESRTTDADGKGFAERLDEAELSVTRTGETGNERKIAENTSEDSAEDRSEQVYYGPRGRAKHAPGDEPTKKLDLSG